MDQPTAPEPTEDGDPVDLATGFFTSRKTDLVFPGPFPLVLTRTYRTGDTFAGPFGVGGRHAFDIFLVPPTPTATDQLVLFLPNLSRYAFARQADGTFKNTTDPAMQGAVITLPDEEETRIRVLTFKDRSVWVFSQNGALVQQADRNGNGLIITRNPLAQVVNLQQFPGGREVGFTYLGTGQQITRVRERALLSRILDYTYDASGRLATVTDPNGGITRYTYDALGRMSTLTDPRGISFLTNEYDTQGRVCRQHQADGGLWTFFYIPADAAGTPEAERLLAEAAAGGPVTRTPCTVMGSAGPVLATVVVNPRGQPTTHRFNGAGYAIARTDALGQTTTFERAPGTNLLLRTTDPLGRVTRNEYDAAGNVIRTTDPQ